MNELLIASALAFFITIAATPVTIKLAKKYNLVDDPNKRPHPAHVHSRIIPRAGGLSIFLGLVIAILFFVPLTKAIIGIILAISLLLIVGLMDDAMENFSPYPRFAMHFMAAAIAVGAGIGITFVTNPFGGVLRLDEIIIPVTLFGQHHIVLIADIFAFFWIVWMMNMVNWAKGIDGQMPGIISVTAITIGLVSYDLFIRGDPNQFNIALLSFITTGAALGFLVFNWYPSKILPGQSASTILGFMIAVLSILSGAKLASALLVLLIPSIDFFYTFFRRIINKKSPFFGDRKHLHHMLLNRGWSHPQISLFYITTSVILGILAPILSPEGKLFTVIGIGIIVLGILVWLHLFSNNVAPIPGPKTSTSKGKNKK